MIRLIIADDHAMVRQWLRRLFTLVDDIVVDGEATDGTETIERLAENDVDLLLLDIRMPGPSGPDLIALVRGRHPELRILVLSMHIEPHIAQGALDAGANGYLTKDQDGETLIAAIREVAAGGRYVDPRLAPVLGL
jgi:DNA-binding NarL/FixJ family response regulator